MEKFDVLDVNLDKKSQKERPVLVTVICMLGFMGVMSALLSNILLSFEETSVMDDIEVSLQLLSWITMVIGFISMLGLWKMKRWAFLLYIVMNIISVGVMALIGYLDILSIILPFVVIVLLATQYKNMN